MSANTDWKQKYFDSLDQLEKLENTWQRTESLLCQSINRVSLAAEGIDSRLDKQLSNLRQIVRNGDQYQDLNSTIDSISKSLKRIDDQKESQQNPFLAWLQILEKLKLPRSAAKPAQKLKKSISKAKGNGETDLLIDEFARMLNSVITDHTETEKPGLLERLLPDSRSKQKPQEHEQEKPAQTSQSGDSPAPQTPAPAPAQSSQAASEDSAKKIDQAIAQFGLKLLEHLDFPQEIDEQVMQVRDLLGAKTNNLKRQQVLKQLSELLTQSRLLLENEKLDLEGFLHTLTDNLQDIYQNIAGVEGCSKDQLNIASSFNEDMQNQVKEMEDSVQSATDLKLLKTNIQTKLHAIRKNLQQHIQTEAQAQQKLTHALSKTTSQLRNLEQETKLLRERLYQEHQLAMQDPLTGLSNRLAYEEHVHQEYERWKRYHQPLVLMLVDIDHFKKINDTYGHRAGDKALKLIAGNLEKKLRNTDLLARYGGEEFVVLMPQTDLASAMVAAEKLRVAVQSCGFHYQEQRVEITICCGLSEFTGTDTIESVFTRADKALYQAKNNGRNRCESIAN